MAESDEKKYGAGCWAATDAHICSFQETIAASVHIVKGYHTIQGVDNGGFRRSPATMWKLMLCEWFSHFAFLLLIGLIYFAWLAAGVALIYASLKEDKGIDTIKIVLIVWSVSVPIVCAPFVVKTRGKVSEAVAQSFIESTTTS